MQIAPQDMVSCMVHHIIEQRCFFSGAKFEHNFSDFLHADDAARMKETLAFPGRIGTDARAEDIQLASKFNAILLDDEKLWLTLTQEGVKIKTVASTIVASGKQVESLEIENWLLLQIV